jgi:hypothetical protein
MKKKVTELLIRAVVFIVSAVSFVVMYMFGKWAVDTLWKYL